MSNLLTAEITEVFSKVKSVSTLIITVGNSLRADDGVGPYIAERIGGCSGIEVIDAGSKPENVIDQAVSFHPKMVIIVDAADFGGIPGAVKLVDEQSIPETSLSTHAIPLKIVYKLLVADTGAKVVFVGIQPQSVEIKEELSQAVKAAADSLIELIRKESRN